jgi:hypothetical protein
MVVLEETTPEETSRTETQSPRYTIADFRHALTRFSPPPSTVFRYLLLLFCLQ